MITLAGYVVSYRLCDVSCLEVGGQDEEGKGSEKE